MKEMYICVFVLCLVVRHSSGKAVPGPQNAMEHLHGVLMHGDKKSGDTHKGEDTMKILAEKDKLNAEHDPVGPQDRMSQLHDQLMHKDGKGSHDFEKTGPEDKKDFQVKDGMDHLHGVLMHGDGKKGKDHEREDEIKRDQHKKGGKDEVPDLMDDVHGVLMHGDRERGKDHKHEDSKKQDGKERGAPNGADLEKALHGGDHKHDKEIKQPEGEMDPNLLWEKKKKGENRLAFSFGNYISSDILDNVDKLKNRYLSKFFGGGGDKKGDKGDSEGRVVSPRMRAAVEKEEDRETTSGSGRVTHDDGL